MYDFDFSTRRGYKGMLKLLSSLDLPHWKFDKPLQENAKTRRLYNHYMQLCRNTNLRRK